MKKLICILMVIPYLAISQSEKLKVSLLTGPTFSWLTTDENTIESKGNRLGFKLHLQGEYLFNDKFSITSGLGLSFLQGGSLNYKQGGNLWSETKWSVPHGDSLPNGVNLSYRVKYFEIPVAFKMRTAEFGKYRFYAQLPEFFLGVRLGARGNINGQGIVSKDENIKSQIYFVSLGWGLGFGTEYHFKENIDLLFGVRYQQSLTDVTDDSGRYFDGTSQNSKDKINAIDIRIGIIF